MSQVQAAEPVVSIVRPAPPPRRQVQAEACGRNPWELYEEGKRELQTANLSSEAYDAAIAKLLCQLGL